MNRGLREATGDIVLFLDDDIIPHEHLVAGHRQAYVGHPEAWAVVGQVRQWENAEMLKRFRLRASRLRRTGKKLKS
ncbi:MAG: glycosyltransferase family A protein [Kiritimatiellia bacterium]